MFSAQEQGCDRDHEDCSVRPAAIDILIPTFQRPAALAVTLTSLIGQTFPDFRVVISDQSGDSSAETAGEVQAAIRVLRSHGHAVEMHRHLPRRGMAEQRQFLLDQATAPYTLFLDDDVILEVDMVGRMQRAIRRAGCGFIGCAVIGLRYLHVVRPHEEEVEFWEDRVVPEEVRPGTAAWQRHRLHNACNLYHVQGRLPRGMERLYRIAWVGGCVLYDTAALRACGGFSFWRQLPTEHCGEDVLAQLRVMARFGGAGLMPSGAYHQDLPTTVHERRINAPELLPLAYELGPTAPSDTRVARG